MEKILHPYRMTLEEVKQLMKIVRGGKVFIDLFGGSGVVSLEATKHFDEVIYNDIRRDKFINVKEFKEIGIETFKDDFSEILPFADRRTVVFADPPFYGMNNFDRWCKKDHQRLLKALSDSDAKVLMLNSKAILRLTDFKVIMEWKFRQDDTELRDNVVLLSNR